MNSAERRPVRHQTPAVPASGRRNLVRQSIHILVHYPQIADKLGDMSGIEVSARPGVPLLVELLNSLQESPCNSTGALLERWRDRPDVEHLSKLARLECYIPDAAGAVRELRDALEHLRDEGALVRREQLLAKHSREGLDESEKLELQTLLQGKRPVAP